MKPFDLRLIGGAVALAATLGAAAASAASGEQLFNENCAACHQKMGQGIPGAFPALKGDKIVLGDNKVLTFVVLTGRGGMPAFKDSLSDADLASILTYVRHAWGNNGKPITAAEFAKARTGPPPSTKLQAH